MTTRPPALNRSDRRRPLVFAGFAVLVGAALVWLVGFFWFAALLPNEASVRERKTDAIVVLTGGSGRLSKGLELLAQKNAEKLFVSGVYRGVEVAELLRLSRQAPEELSCCIALGYEADNTRGNAIESAAWMRKNDFSSLRLVTATYHMPRSLIEFRRQMPNIEIVPHPVLSAHFKQSQWWRYPGSTSLLASEYTKFLIALLRARWAALIS